MKARIELNDVLQNSPNLILYVAPILIGLALFEVGLSIRHNKSLYEGKDFLTSLIIGVVHLIEGLFTKTAFFLLVIWLYNLVPWSIPVNVATSILCFVILDFLRYWAHRLSHEINFLWATHVTHHNSTRFNLSTAFRQSWTQGIKIIFFLPISLLGFHPVVFYIVHQLALLYSFSVHTKTVKKMPRWYAYIFVTPAHHKVHHARNKKYLDKNYGSALIIWDRLFNTFEELDEAEEPEFGILDQPATFNPFYLVFHVWIDIFKKIREAGSFREVWDILMKSPGTVKNGHYAKTGNRSIVKA